MAWSPGLSKGTTPAAPGLPSVGHRGQGCREDSLLNVDEDAQHVLVHLQALQQSSLAAENKGDAAQRPGQPLPATTQLHPLLEAAPCEGTLREVSTLSYRLCL